MKLIDRPGYTGKILDSIGKNLIICLTGQRRVGKSSLLKLLRSRLESEGHNVVYVDKEKSSYDDICTYIDLNQHIDSHLSSEEHNFILIDEVQMIENFERSLVNYYDKENIDIIVTGSNAKMFSSELATLLSGRYIELHVHGLSYKEFLTFHKLEDSDTSLLKYLDAGGLPNLVLFDLANRDAINDYLDTIFNTILVKDIVSRESVRNVPFLEKLARYIADNIGKPFSATNISNFMQKEKVDITPSLVGKYIQYMKNAYLLHSVNRFDLHGKQLLLTNEKYYFEDMGLRNSLTAGHRSSDLEKLMENAVYLHLLNMGCKVTVGTLRKGEVDFIAEKGNEKAYFQVTYLLASEETFQREFGILKIIDDNFPKYVISMDPYQPETFFEGISHLRLRTFLNIDDVFRQP